MPSNSYLSLRRISTTEPTSSSASEVLPSNAPSRMRWGLSACRAAETARRSAVPAFAAVASSERSISPDSFAGRASGILRAAAAMPLEANAASHSASSGGGAASNALESGSLLADRPSRDCRAACSMAAPAALLNRTMLSVWAAAVGHRDIDSGSRALALATSTGAPPSCSPTPGWLGSVATGLSHSHRSRVSDTMVPRMPAALVCDPDLQIPDVAAISAATLSSSKDSNLALASNLCKASDNSRAASFLS